MTSSTYSDLLLPHHSSLLSSSAISPGVAEARRYRSVETRAELERLGFSSAQRRVPALLLPVWTVRGEIGTYQIRPDEPRVNRRGKSVKYEIPQDSSMVLDVPPPVRGWIGDPKRPLFVTEGVRKADAAASIDLCCIALLGVWNWRGRNDGGGYTALADWESVALKGRLVYVVFDSDVMTKKEVHAALSRLKTFLESRGASIRLVYLPPDKGGEKVGLDDYLAVDGHDVSTLMELASSELRGLANDDPPETYLATDDGMMWQKPSREGTIPTLLTNFVAKITEDVTEDDGVEKRRTFWIEASLRGRTTRFSIPATQFASMNWATDHLGAAAIVFPGFGVKDHTRTAIQVTSGDVTRRVTYGHLGWRKIGGDWVYLHAGGAIGADGAVPDVSVKLPSALALFELPEPPDKTSLRTAIKRNLAFLELAPHHITVPVHCQIWRSVLRSTDFNEHLSGRTGEGKTALAALAQQHFGSGMDAEHLPASWSSTGNSLEALAFRAKDALLVVDDFAPAGGRFDVERLHKEADRLMRAQRNRSGQGRLRADATLGRS